jgi:hypothetical protein
MEGDEDDDVGVIERRQIYYKRLIGDSMFGGGDKKIVQGKKGSVTGVLFFLLYFIIALVVIMDRSDVATQFAVNKAIRTALEETPYVTSPSKETFKDILTLDDAVKWMTDAVLPLLASGGAFNSCEEDPTAAAFQQKKLRRLKPGCRARAVPFSLLSFNRVLPAAYLKQDEPNARVRLTLRKMMTEGGAEVTNAVTKRFDQYVENVWSGRATEGTDTDNDDTSILNGKYAYQGVPDNLIKPQQGCPDCDRLVNVGEEVDFLWQHCGTGCGYRNQGGYVLDVIVKPTPAQQAFLNTGPSLEAIKDRVVREQYIRLHQEGDTIGMLPGGEVHGLDALLKADGIIDAQVSFMAWEMWLYNANLQTLSQVRVPMVWNAAGYLQAKRVEIETILLQLDNPTIQYFEYAYLGLTLYQATIWLWRFHKGGRKSMKDFWFWLDLFSTICSLTAIFVWQSYERGAQGFTGYNFTAATRSSGAEKVGTGIVPNEDEIEKRIEEFKVYTRVSSFATLTIALRILKFLGSTVSRVKLLQHTLYLSYAPFFWYMAYIGILFFGFMNFGQVNFAMESEAFRDLFKTLITCFSMFMGKVDAIDTISPNNIMRTLYFVPFMMFFFFVSVQMFNSIINYSYNSSREEYEPIFARERSEAKARAIQNKNKPSFIQQLFRPFMRRRKGYRLANAAPVAATQGPSLEGVRDAVREKVQTHLRIEKEKQQADSALDLVIFLLFMGMYIVFLILNLRVEPSFEMRSRIDDAIASATVQLARVDGQFEHATAAQVTNMDEADQWLTRALGNAIFAGAGDRMPKEMNTMWPKDVEGTQKIVPDGTGPSGRTNLCFSGWNCMLMKQGRDENQEAIQGEVHMMRITTRKVMLAPNIDTTDASGVPDAPSYGEQIVKFRISNTTTSARSLLDPEMESMSEAWANPTSPAAVRSGSGLCKFTKPSVKGAKDLFDKNVEEGGYDNAGGYQCLFTPDPDEFEGMMSKWRDEFAISVESQMVMAELITYNPNVGMMAYTEVQMSLQQSGSVDISIDTVPFLIRNYDETTDFIELIPLFIYLFLTIFYYFVQQINKMFLLYVKKMTHSRGPFVQLIITLLLEHFGDDFFNVLDWVSITLSIMSFILFMIFTIQIIEFDKNFAEDFPTFMTTISQLSASMRLYVRLSAFNVIVIFFRSLKFFRESPRMNKLSQTLALAGVDIFWFVVMLFIVMIGFVCFSFVSFGHQIEGLSSFFGAVRYCFEMIIGEFDFWPIYEVDPIMANFFFFFFILIFNCIFVNIFFAIIDCFFITSTPPPINWKAKLKPMLAPLPVFSLIQWDDDINMEEGHVPKDTQEVPSRTDAAKKARLEIERLRREAAKSGAKTDFVECYDITDPKAGVESEEKFSEVVVWARDESRKYMGRFQKFKEEKNTFPSEQEFVIKKRKELHRLFLEEEQRMKESERRMKYALQLHERSAVADLDTVCRYMLLLEHKIQRKSLKMMRLTKEKDFLKKQAELLQYSEAELEERLRAADFTALEESGHDRAMDAVEDDLEALQDQKEHDQEAVGNQPPAGEPDGLMAKDQSESKKKQRKEFMGRLTE